MKKGDNSRSWIIEESIKVLNKSGIDITLNELSGQLGISRGRINHFFPTKEKLFIAIGERYQEKLSRIRSDFRFTDEILNLNELAILFGLIMDNQIAHKCIILYAASSGSHRSEMLKHIDETYVQSLQDIKDMVEGMVHFGILNSRILQPDIYDVFVFQFTNLFTVWVINKEIYHSEIPYEMIKPIYLKGILGVLEPYLNKSNR